MLCSSHPLCLSAESRGSLSERQEGQRLAARLCSHFSTRGPMVRGSSLASAVASGGGWKSQGRESWTSYQADARDIASAVASGSSVQWIGRSNLGLGIFFSCVAPWSGASSNYADSLGVRRGFKMHLRESHIFLANVGRQVSLAGGNGSSHR
jgi:hypothetical protein